MNLSVGVRDTPLTRQMHKLMLSAVWLRQPMKGTAYFLFCLEHVTYYAVQFKTQIDNKDTSEGATTWRNLRRMASIVVVF